MTVTLVILGVIVVSALFFAVRRLRRPQSIIFQFGKFENERLGIKGHAFWEDEPDIVKYTDYKYWVRIKPNPGINLPKIGYWSKARGRKR